MNTIPEKEFDRMVSLLAKAEMEKKNAEKEISRLKASLKEVLEAEGVDCIDTKNHHVKLSRYISNRFDSKAFKEDHIDLYESYLVGGEVERLTYK